MPDETRLSMLVRVQDANSDDAWTDFSEMYDGMIHRWLRQNHVPPADADDVRQEVMTVVYRSVGKFEHNGRTGAFRAWLRTITSNCLKNHWRKNNRAGGADLGDLAAELEDDSSRQTLLWNAEHDRYVLDHLLTEIGKRLSAQSVLVFRRIVIQQEDAAHVASELDMSLGAVRVAQHRVLKALKVAAEGLLELD